MQNLYGLRKCRKVAASGAANNDSTAVSTTASSTVPARSAYFERHRNNGRGGRAGRGGGRGTNAIKMSQSDKEEEDSVALLPPRRSNRSTTLSCGRSDTITTAAKEMSNNGKDRGGKSKAGGCNDVTYNTSVKGEEKVEEVDATAANQKKGGRGKGKSCSIDVINMIDDEKASSSSVPQCNGATLIMNDCARATNGHHADMQVANGNFGNEQCGAGILSSSLVPIVDDLMKKEHKNSGTEGVYQQLAVHEQRQLRIEDSLAQLTQSINLLIEQSLLMRGATTTATAATTPPQVRQTPDPPSSTVARTDDGPRSDAGGGQLSSTVNLLAATIPTTRSPKKKRPSTETDSDTDASILELFAVKPDNNASSLQTLLFRKKKRRSDFRGVAHAAIETISNNTQTLLANVKHDKVIDEIRASHRILDRVIRSSGY